MVRKWITPVAALALLAGLSIAPAVRADDAPPAAAGKAKISVKVVDGDGKAIAGATVDLMPPAAGKRGKHAADPAPKMMAADPADPATPAPTPKPKRTRPKPLQSTTTEADGTATLKDVADGSYSVVARLKGTGNGHEKVTVTDGKDVSVTVTIKPKN